MRIDKTHVPWFFFSVALLAVCGAIYSRYAASGTPSGGSFWGLTFGIAGSAFILFAALLGYRKRFRTLRVGSSQFWMRGHLWLGALALPMILFHGGFRHGGTLSSVLMWLLYAVVVSGLIGAILQHVLPRYMSKQLSREVSFEQIPEVMMHLRAEAEDVVAVCGPGDGEDLERWRQRRSAKLKMRQERSLITAGRREALAGALAAAPVAGSEPLRQFYDEEVRPFLEGNGGSRSKLCEVGEAVQRFERRRTLLPPSLHTALDELREICDENRQLLRQRRLHYVLHVWLLLHVPLSVALVLLGVVHAVVALRYS